MLYIKSDVISDMRVDDRGLSSYNLSNMTIDMDNPYFNFNMTSLRSFFRGYYSMLIYYPIVCILTE